MKFSFGMSYTQSVIISVVGLSLIEIKNILQRKKEEYYTAYKEATVTHEKKHNFSAWQTINKLDKEITEIIKKRTGPS